MEVNRKQIISVGIDLGTTTTHLVFSKLTLENDPFSRSRKLIVTERQVIYQSKIYFTPLKNENSEIDVHKILPIILNEYEQAGIGLNEIDSGAVIITGESSRKVNAEEIVRLIAGESGKFVAATAGPNFESVISAHVIAVPEAVVLPLVLAVIRPLIVPAPVPVVHRVLRMRPSRSPSIEPRTLAKLKAESCNSTNGTLTIFELN